MDASERQPDSPNVHRKKKSLISFFKNPKAIEGPEQQEHSTITEAN